MRPLAQKPRTTQQVTSARSAIAGRAYFKDNHAVNFLHAERKIGNQNGKQLIEGNTRDVNGDSTIRESHSGHDFSRIPVRSVAPMPVQPRVTNKVPGDYYGDASSRHAEPTAKEGYPTDTESAAQAPDNLSSDTFSFGTVRIMPIPGPAAGERSSQTIPTADGGEQDIFEPLPTRNKQTPAGPSPVGTASATDSCSQPLSMNKVISGPFLGGLTMDSYFPDLSGRGFWDHAGTGGPFDTGRQAGGNAQLYGVIPSPCNPSQFHLEQTANPVRFRIGGVPHPLEGTTFDDIARSGRDASRAPFRQDFLGGGTSPPGYIISMADPPSVGYSSSRPDIERDTNFVTSLVGPGGRRSISWSQSVRVAGGTVTTNTLT
jgi:hypothetical protein